MERATSNTANGVHSNRHRDRVCPVQNHLFWAEGFDILLKEGLWVVGHCEAADLLLSVLVVGIWKRPSVGELC